MRIGRRTLLTVACLAVFALCGAAALVFRNYLSESPLSSRIALRFPDRIVSDREGNLAVLDSGGRRILLLDARHRIVAERYGGSRSAGGFYSAELLGFIAPGSILIQDNIASLVDSRTGIQELKSLRSSGTGLIARFVFDDKQRLDDNYKISFASIVDGRVRFVFPDNAGGYDILNAGTDGITWKIKAGFDASAYFCGAFTDADTLFLVRFNGSIDRASGAGRSSTVWKNEGPVRLVSPSAACSGPDGSLYVLDGKRAVYRLDQTGRLEPVMVSGLGGMQAFAFQSFSVASDGSILGIDSYTSSILIRHPDGRTDRIAALEASPSYVARRLAVWLAAILAALAVLVSLARFYAMVLVEKRPLILKQLVVFIPLILVSFVAVAWRLYSVMETRYEGEVKNKLMVLAWAGASRIDGKGFDSLHPGSGPVSDLWAGKEYGILDKELSSFLAADSHPWATGLYAYLYKKVGDDYWAIGSDEYTELYVYRRPEFETILAKGTSATIVYEDVYGRWYSGFAPVMGPEGKPVGIYEVTINALVFTEFNRAFARSVAVGSIIILIVLVFVLAAFTWVLLQSLKKLKAGAEHIAAGDYSIEVRIESRDELEDLGAAFNSMTGEVRRNIEKNLNLIRANSKFVPVEFLRNLNTDSITDLNLGDHVLKEMTVMFADIRSFTSISEAISPEENFQFLNEYLSVMGPVIRRHGGFIDKYIGDAIMALFPNRPDDAIDAALSMMEKLDEFNRGYRIGRGRADLGPGPAADPIRIGIGIHTGKLMLGIIGEAERFDGSVISDAVNFASRLEGFTKQYGIGIAASETTISRLSPDSVYRSRFIDIVRVVGRSEAASVYEVIAPGDPDLDRKLRTAELYASAFALYRAADFARATALYHEILAIFPEDKPAASFIKRCERLAVSGPPAGWAGVFDLRDK